MGGNPYFYFVEHRPSPFEALQTLREREFLAGRYEPGFGDATGTYMFELEFPPNETSPAPGPRHDSIAAAVHDSDASGTNSILDIERVTDASEFLAASPMDASLAARAFGPKASRRVMIEMLQGREPPGDYDALDRIFDEIARGEARFLEVTDDDGSKHYFFLGYSVD